MPRKLHAHQIDIKYTILNLLIFQTRKNRTIRWTILPNRYKIYYFKPTSSDFNHTHFNRTSKRTEIAILFKKIYNNLKGAKVLLTT